MKHTPANPACHFILPASGDVLIGVCKVCGAKKEFRPYERYTEWGQRSLQSEPLEMQVFGRGAR